MTAHDPSVWLASIAEVFDRLGVEWVLVGALAANRYRATARFTTDLDTMARYHNGLVAALESAGYEVTVFADGDEPPRSILEAGVSLDADYLAHWIAEWELAERWETFGTGSPS